MQEWRALLNRTRTTVKVTYTKRAQLGIQHFILDFVSRTFTQEYAIYWSNQNAVNRHYGPFQVEFVETDSTENSYVTELNKFGRVSYYDTN